MPCCEHVATGYGLKHLTIHMIISIYSIILYTSHMKWFKKQQYEVIFIKTCATKFNELNMQSAQTHTCTHTEHFAN